MEQNNLNITKETIIKWFADHDAQLIKENRSAERISHFLEDDIQLAKVIRQEFVRIVVSKMIEEGKKTT